MRFNKFVLTGITALASLGMGSEALANGRNPGSLLLYPEFDNRQSNLTMIAVTNTNQDTSFFGNTSIFSGTVRVEFIYIAKFDIYHNVIDCTEFNRTETLTPNDTFCALTSFHNPGYEQGYVYVFAKAAYGPNIGQPITHNWLIGNTLAIKGFEALDYSINPVAFKGLTAPGALTDVDGDGNRDLNGDGAGAEYEGVPDQILIPRFLGSSAQAQSSSQFASEMILIALSGGTAFTTRANFWIYNDNEEAFSANFIFKCWDRVPVLQISNAFLNSFLHNQTNDAPNEIFGASARESGWVRVYGGSQSSGAESISDAAIYAVLIEKLGYTYAAADLPFETAALQANRNGSLLPTGPFGDGDPNAVNFDQQ
jgi:hypothetical protein